MLGKWKSNCNNWLHVTLFDSHNIELSIENQHTGYQYIERKSINFRGIINQGEDLTEFACISLEDKNAKSIMMYGKKCVETDALFTRLVQLDTEYPFIFLESSILYQKHDSLI